MIKRIALEWAPTVVSVAVVFTAMMYGDAYGLGARSAGVVHMMLVLLMAVALGISETTAYTRGMDDHAPEDTGTP